MEFLVFFIKFSAPFTLSFANHFNIFHLPNNLNT